MHPPLPRLQALIPHAFFAAYYLVLLFAYAPCLPKQPFVLPRRRLVALVLLLCIPLSLILLANHRRLTLPFLASYILAAASTVRQNLDQSVVTLAPDTLVYAGYLCLTIILPVHSNLSLLFLALVAPVALRHLVRGQSRKRVLPPPTFAPPRFTTTSLYSLLSFSWVSHLITTGYQRQLKSDDILPLDPHLASTHAASHLQKVRKTIARTSSNPSLLHTIVRAFGLRILKGVLVGILLHFIAFIPPIILRSILLSLQESHSVHGFYLALGLFVTLICQSVIAHQWFNIKSRIFTQIRGALNSQVYAKSARLSVQSRATYTSGRIQNLMAIDTYNVSKGTSDLTFMLVVMQQLSTVLFLLQRLLGTVPTIATLAILLLFALVQGCLMIRTKRFREALGGVTDERVKLVSEGIKGIKLVKLYAWEIPFVNRILDTRHKELAYVRKVAITQAFNSMIVTSLPTLLVVTAFAAYLMIGNALDAAVVFPVIVTFNIIRTPLIAFPSSILAVARAIASLSRLEKFFSADELTSLGNSRHAIDQEYLNLEETDIAAFDASFAWDPSKIPLTCTLSSLTLQIPTGSLVAVVGPTGGGKSALLSAFLSELSIFSGKAGLRGSCSISYCDQIPFIQNATLRDNILFGKPFYPDHYWDTIHVCALKPDLEMLPAGDHTEIGSRGVNLSGGQRSRVSLARAVYARADICLLDDPLCAVDARVGKAIFANGIVSALRGTTRLLTTNQIHFAASPDVDFVMVVKDGKIIEQGSQESLLASEKSEFSQLVKGAGDVGAGDILDDRVSEDSSALFDDGSDTTQASSSHSSCEAHTTMYTREPEKERLMNYEDKKDCKPMKRWRLTNSETREHGRVRLQHYATYLRALDFWRSVVPFLLFAFGTKVLNLTVDMLFSDWSEQDDSGNTLFQLAVFVALGLASVLTTAGAVFSMAYGSIRASRSLHESLLLSVFGATSAFFHATPDGQIINRFHSDLDKVDSLIVPTASGAMRLILDLLFTFGIMIWASPWIILAIVPATAVCIFIQEYYRKCSVDVRRLQSVAKSPLYSHFSESLDGIVTIRAYKDVPRGSRINNKHSDNLCKTTYAMYCANRWLGTRLDCASATLVFLATILTVSSPSLRLSAGRTGLVLSYVLQMLSTTLRFVRQFTQLESDMSSVERISEYTAPSFPREEKGGLEGLFSKQKRILGTNDEQGVNQPRCDIAQPAMAFSCAVEQWPAEGRIDFEDVAMRYRKDLDPVLKNISFTVKAGEHVGIVGRTGAGKSSAINCLFRLQELSKGRITVDGTDISDVPLHKLRSSIGIIPQEPVCFSGTIWSNLDMSGQYSQEEVQRALDECGLQSTTSRKMKLSDKVCENGSNLSVGQRQLLCLGRVLLRESRILVLDEATSSVTNEIDEIIQTTLREKMKHCTIVTIAHRLHTVMRSDKIMVMEKGEIVEIGTPAELLERDSRLGAMVDETGPATAAHLRKMVRDSCKGM